MMVDFLMISTRSAKRGTIEIYPKFIVNKTNDLMIRGGDFYAVWLDDKGLWSTDENDALQLIDRELDKYAEEHKSDFDSHVKVLHMWDAETRMIDSWHRFCQKDMRDSFHTLDEKLIFANSSTNKKDYASKKLSYPLEYGDISAYDSLMNVLYSPEERKKIEWAIGSIVCGDSKKIQKFMVLYGSAGTGKSTVLNIIQQLFDGYYSVFDAKALGSASNSFALEAFKTNPLVAIQHDGDLSRIEDNTRLNSLVSHEMMTVNEKFKSTYSNKFKSFLFMGTNKPVKITDAKSGLIRRLIDVSPTGEKIPLKEYRTLTKQIEFELGAIAMHCRDVYLNDPGAYDNYIPISMLGASNDFYNFIQDAYYIFQKEDSTTLKIAWEMYNAYCSEAKVPYPYPQRAFKEELKNYFCDYKDRAVLDDGTRVRSYYIGFKTEKFEEESPPKKVIEPKGWIEFKEQHSVLDDLYSEFPAQYARDDGTPRYAWDNVTTKLKDLITTKLHYILFPKDHQHHIVIDFDIPDENGNKCFEKNFEAANKWPKTYAELSKSGEGIHLHYIYSGDPSKLSSLYDDHIEIKVYTGKSSLRRKLSMCNDIYPAQLSSGLPLKGDKKMINTTTIKNEKALRTLIERSLRKEIHPNTRPNIDFIAKILDEAYNTPDLHYDVSDLESKVLKFAMSSTNQSEYCIKKVDEMKFSSEEISNYISNDDAKLVFFDVEVFPNLFLVNWKIEGPDHKVNRMINPSQRDIEELIKYRLVGFNNRDYDNHMLYARLLGYSEEQIFDLSQRIIVAKDRTAKFAEAYNISYTDIYDFSSKKQSLKKFEIELGIHHQELGLPWNEPVPKERWVEVAEYCDNDVIATEAVFNARQEDFVARKILADIAGMTVNDTTNSLTTRIIFGKERHPQDQFNYRNMGEVTDDCQSWTITDGLKLYDNFGDPEYTLFNKDGKPVFPGYKFEYGKSLYRGEDPKEGGYVYAEPGIYTDVCLLDIASMHPSSIVAENLFGKYTKNFEDILRIRILIKHKQFEEAKKLMDGKLAKYLEDEAQADKLSKALKIPINSVYGLTSAKFDNPFRDKRNKDNIVAKRGALFMINLKHEVQNRGFKVAHIKTDSIKVPNATPEIIQFITDYGKQYGYNFEHEATYDRMCLVNDAVYIAKYATVEHCEELYGSEYVESATDICKDNKKHPGKWTATGTEFQVPYIFKTLFSKEPIEFDDMCECKAVQTALYLDFNENLPENEHDYHFIGKIGQFCPVKTGCNGGILLREGHDKDGNIKYDAVSGSKGYRWCESEVLKNIGKTDDIDKSYYRNMVDSAIDSIKQYGDFDLFVSDSPYILSDNERPPWYSPDEPWAETTPFDVR